MSKQSLPELNFLFEEGNRFFRRQDFGGALYYHQRCIARDPRNPQYLSAVARDLAALGRVSEARTICLRALDAAPDYTYARELFKYLGGSLPADMRGDRSKSHGPFSDPREMTQLPPEREEDRLFSAYGVTRPHRQPAVSGTEELSPPARGEDDGQRSEMEMLLRNAYIALQSGRLDEAWRSSTAAIQVSPGNGYAYYLRGAVEERKGIRAAARQDYEQAFRLGRQVGGIGRRLARVGSSLGQ